MVDLAEITSGSLALKKRNNLSDDIADLLRGLILLEKFHPGMPLSEREIAASLGISRTPLREAIRQLEREGLVEYSASRRPRVANPSLEEITDYLRVQGQLEALGGELACANASDKELENIARMNQELLDSYGKEDSLDSFRRDMAVHSAIIAAGHNKPLIETHATYNARLWRARFMSSQRKTGLEKTMQEHREFVDALLHRDAPRTAFALRNHLTTAVTNIALALQEKTALSGDGEQDR